MNNQDFMSKVAERPFPSTDSVCIYYKLLLREHYKASEKSEFILVISLFKTNILSGL